MLIIIQIKTKQMTSIIDLPPELIQKIGKYLDAKSLGRMQVTCQQFREQLSIPSLWEKFCLEMAVDLSRSTDWYRLFCDWNNAVNKIARMIRRRYTIRTNAANKIACMARRMARRRRAIQVALNAVEN